MLVFVYILVKIENGLCKIVLFVVDNLFILMLVIFIMGFLIFIVVGLLMCDVGFMLGDVLNWLYDLVGFVGGVLFGFIYVFFVIIGMYYSFIVIEI